jgi:hypothetical protein
MHHLQPIVASVSVRPARARITQPHEGQAIPAAAAIDA